MMDHVIGRCSMENPTILTTCHGISAKLYGHWLRAENNASLLFVNLPEREEVDRKYLAFKEIQKKGA